MSSQTVRMHNSHSGQIAQETERGSSSRILCTVSHTPWVFHFIASPSRGPVIGALRQANYVRSHRPPSADQGSRNDLQHSTTRHSIHLCIPSCILRRCHQSRSLAQRIFAATRTHRCLRPNQRTSNHRLPPQSYAPIPDESLPRTLIQEPSSLYSPAPPPYRLDDHWDPIDRNQHLGTERLDRCLDLLSDNGVHRPHPEYAPHQSLCAPSSTASSSSQRLRAAGLSHVSTLAW